MTEAEWLAQTVMSEADWLRMTDPALMLRYLIPRRRGRKKRLFACACCRSIWGAISDGTCRRAVETAERYADGEPADRGTILEAASLRLMALETDDIYEASAENRTYYAAQAAVLALSYGLDVWDTASRAIEAWEGKADRAANKSVQCDFLRDIFGNPFRPFTFSPDWRTDPVLTLATQMYESRDFSAMPILGDALQDAGCDNTDVLDHCRGEETHVRGCWVVDLVLGKQ